MTHLFLGGEVVDNVEELPDLVRALSFDHICHSLASNVAEKYINKRDNKRFPKLTVIA